jgi:hypothetical protein
MLFALTRSNLLRQLPEGNKIILRLPKIVTVRNYSEHIFGNCYGTEERLAHILGGCKLYRRILVFLQFCWRKGFEDSRIPGGK